MEELAAHPYISWKLAKSLIRYRRQWGEEPIPVEVWREWLPDTLRNRLERTLPANNFAPMLLETLREVVREIPDFPQPGVIFKDISPLFLRPRLVERCVEELARLFRVLDVDKVVGIESRGFLLGPMIALELEAGFALCVRRQVPQVAASISI